MASSHYYGTLNDSLAILAALAQQGLKLILEPEPQALPEAPTFASVNDEVARILSFAPAFYLSGSFTRFPVPFTRLDRGAAEGRYLVSALAQGPLMQACVARLREVEGVPTLLPGDIAYQVSYRHPETGAWERPSDELKRAYKDAVRAIRKLCIRTTVRGVAIHIGPEGLKHYEAGARIGLMPGERAT
jgi:hypothetical protein